MDNDVSIGHTKSPDLVVSMLNFYFQIRGLEAVSHYRDHGITNRVYILFENPMDADDFRMMHSDDYKYFLEIVFRYIMDTFYGIGKSKKVDFDVKSKASPDEIAQQLLDACKFESEKNNDSE